MFWTELEDEQQEPAPPCMYPGCKSEGLYPAPQNPRALNKRLMFCLKHVREYNASWNGLDGFSSQEIFKMQHGNAHWNRPTWELGVGTESYESATFTQTAARDPFSIFNHLKNSATSEQKKAPPPETDYGVMPGQIRKACLELEIIPPLTKENVKSTYRSLARKYHPDLNKNAPESEEQLKRINDAYKTLLKYLEKRDA